MRVLIVVEKASHARAVMAAIERTKPWPDALITAFQVGPFGPARFVLRNIVPLGNVPG